MRTAHCLAILLFMLSAPVLVQAGDTTVNAVLKERGELRFSFQEKDFVKRQDLAKFLSIDFVTPEGRVDAYANEEEFSLFLKKGYAYSLIKPRVKAKSGEIFTAQKIEEMQYWQAYPSYPLYLEMMSSFQAKYPSLCQIDTIGYSVNGRLLLAARLSSEKESKTFKVPFFYSACLHGDELTGYVLLLRLIDFLLSNYEHDPEVQQLLDEMEISINPNANPDGTYFFSDVDISGARRYNANLVDLNRSFPPIEGVASRPGNRENSLAVENGFLLRYIQAHSFVLGASLHGGAEVLNFPWDFTTSVQQRPLDSLWWRAIAAQFVDSARVYANELFRSVTPLGYVYGGDWYVVYGSKQDYLNAYCGFKDLTLEISAEKMPQVERLTYYWNANYRSLIQYMKQALFCIKGVVTDSLSGRPIQAEVSIHLSKDLGSHIKTKEQNGFFCLPVLKGSYSLEVSASDYETKRICLEVSPTALPFLEVQLSKKKEQEGVYPNPVGEYATLRYAKGIRRLVIYALDGSTVGNDVFDGETLLRYSFQFLKRGIYILEVELNDSSKRQSKFVKL